MYGLWGERRVVEYHAPRLLVEDRERLVTAAGSYTGDNFLLLRLADGRIVLSYGNRCINNFGIDARISRDDGATWGAPIRLANRTRHDGGYPSNVQLADGRIVTAFYNQLPDIKYEMCVSTWDVNDFDKIKK